MSYQAYLDTIKAKTGLTPADFIALARAKGLLEPGVKTGEIVAWLKADYGLGQGHAMAIVLAFKQVTTPRVSRDEKIESYFTGGRAAWREPYEGLMEKWAVWRFCPHGSNGQLHQPAEGQQEIRRHCGHCGPDGHWYQAERG